MANAAVLDTVALVRVGSTPTSCTMLVKLNRRSTRLVNGR